MFDYNDGPDKYISAYYSLKRKAENAPLSREESERLELCKSVLQKRHELQMFDLWLKEALRKEGD